MSSHNDVYYDAHIKTHQRHLLITWLESAKAEKIRAMKESIVIPTERYVAPVLTSMKPVSLEMTEKDKARFKKKFEGINTSISFENIAIDPTISTIEQKTLAKKFAGIFNVSLIHIDEATSITNIPDSVKATITLMFSRSSFGLGSFQPNSFEKIMPTCKLNEAKFANVQVDISSLSAFPTPEQITIATKISTSKFNSIHTDISPLSPLPNKAQIASAIKVDPIWFNDTQLSVEIPLAIDFSSSLTEIERMTANSAETVTLSKSIGSITKTVIPESVVSINNENNASVLVDIKVPDMPTLPEQNAEDKKIFSNKFADAHKTVSLPTRISLQEQIAKNNNLAQSNTLLSKIGLPGIYIPSATSIPELTIAENSVAIASANAAKKISVTQGSELTDFLNENRVDSNRFSEIMVDVSAPDIVDLTDVNASADLPSVSLPSISSMDFSEVFEALLIDQNKGVKNL